ncbi:hypothetical protein AM501_05240 [Aneurinibacillus migulanus]|nr:hypothetical protein AM501_05240 [Aneurinibacillus migulanus]
MYLLRFNVSERAIAHRLAVYLENEFPSWNIDCEYNRNIDQIKRIPGEGKTENAVFPDIIIHHRGTQDNLLAIEIKKSNNNNVANNEDVGRLESYKKSLFYRHAAYIIFEVDSEYCGIKHFEWIKDE